MGREWSVTWAEVRGGTFIIGLGARSRVREQDLDFALDRVLQDVGGAVEILATVDRRAAEEAVQAVAARRGWTIMAFPAEALAAQAVPHPSAATAERVGTPSVAEAAALLAGGPGAELVISKRVYPCVTVAVSRGVLA
jgi:cobalamin biosynthesis protein CbiG